MVATTPHVVAKIDSQGRILIPADIRRAAGLNVGDQVMLRVERDEVRVFTRASATRRLREIAARYHVPGRSLVDELIAERRAEAERE